MPQVLNGHTTPETAYFVGDYPYGFTLRCKIRYWLEYKEGHGFRLCAQTTNPKKAGEVWNKPKCSTYAEIAGAMFLNGDGHLTWNSLSRYSGHEEAVKFRDDHPGLEGIALERLTSLIAAYERRDARRAAAAA